MTLISAISPPGGDFSEPVTPGVAARARAHCGRSIPSSRTSGSSPPSTGRRATACMRTQSRLGSRARSARTGRSCARGTLELLQRDARAAGDREPGGARGARRTRPAGARCRPRSCARWCSARARTTRTTPRRRRRRRTRSRSSRSAVLLAPAKPRSTPGRRLAELDLGRRGARSPPCATRRRRAGAVAAAVTEADADRRRPRARRQTRMSGRRRARYRGAQRRPARCSILGRTPRVALGEWVEIRVAGPAARRGQVIDAGERRHRVQVLEDTVGLATRRAPRSTLTGDVATRRGRAGAARPRLQRLGAPVDGLPAPVGEACARSGGAPINPVRRGAPAGLHRDRDLGDRRDEHARARPEAPDLLRARPARPRAGGAASWRARALRTASRSPWCSSASASPRARRARSSSAFRAQRRAASARVLYLNETQRPDDRAAAGAARSRSRRPSIWRSNAGMHVLVVIADMTHYCEALREIATAREEIPGRRGYPGLHVHRPRVASTSAPASCAGKPGSVTQLPILTMPDDDITHPIPDLTGYITEGQIVLSRELHRRGRLSADRRAAVAVAPDERRHRRGTHGESHREWADQLYAIYARGREARMMAAIVGEAGLSAADRRALAFADAFEREFVGSRRAANHGRDVRDRLAAARRSAARRSHPAERRAD